MVPVMMFVYGQQTGHFVSHQVLMLCHKKIGTIRKQTKCMFMHVCVCNTVLVPPPQRHEDMMAANRTT